MARIDWVARRLDNWALWCDRARSGGLGFASQSIFADGPAVRGGCDADGPRIPVLELEASETHEAVESLKLGHGHLYQTLHHFYLKGRGIQGTARLMRRAPSTIHSQLGQADQLLAAWFADRDRRRKASQVSVQRLTPEAAAVLVQQLQAQQPQKRQPFVGPPASVTRRARRTLKLGSSAT